jgi:mono/diheme cytochrome c family protein
MMYSKITKLALLVVVLFVLGALITACGSKASTASPGNVQVPSNPGGPGEAINLTGDAAAGKTIFQQKCQMCHGTDGKGGKPNPGSDLGTIPSLNPIYQGLVSTDLKVFATNIDLFIEHGSTPKGSQPERSMKAFGDEKALTPQQIADVIAYIISLNTK